MGLRTRRGVENAYYAMLKMHVIQQNVENTRYVMLKMHIIQHKARTMSLAHGRVI